MKNTINLLHAIVNFLNLEKENGSTNPIEDLKDLIISLELIDKMETREQFEERVSILCRACFPKRPRAIQWETPNCAIIIGRNKNDMICAHRLYQNDTNIYTEETQGKYTELLYEEEENGNS